MKKPTKPPIVSKEVLLPFILITSLFALWGFANDITNPMVSAFKKILELNNTSGFLGAGSLLWRLFHHGSTGSICSKKILLQSRDLGRAISLCLRRFIVLSGRLHGKLYLFFAGSIYLDFWIGFFRNYRQSFYSLYGGRGNSHPEVKPGASF